MTFEIKSYISGTVLFSLECESFKICLEAAIRKSADLSRAYLSRADLSGAYLSRAYLSRAYLSRAYLSRADLSGADLSRADLSRADLSRANLSGAYLSRANLSGAYLSGANLSGADLSGAKGYNPYRVDPLSLLFDQPGKIRMYKLVKENGEGPFNGGITYEIGTSYEVLKPNTDVNEGCGAGINLATLPWCMKEWAPGCRILLAEFTSEDIAAIPKGNDGKFRVFRCKIVGEKDLKEIGLVE